MLDRGPPYSDPSRPQPTTGQHNLKGPAAMRDSNWG